MRNKVTSAAEAVAVVQSGDAICTSGFVGIGVPDALLVDTGEPRDLTLLFANDAVDEDTGDNDLSRMQRACTGDPLDLHNHYSARVLDCHRHGEIVEMSANPKTTDRPTRRIIIRHSARRFACRWMALP